MKKWLFFLISGLLIAGCSATKISKSAKQIDTVFESNFNENYFIGFLLLDPLTKDTLYAKDAKKYFTPASTTKIFTLYAALDLLPERIPTLKYVAQNDTLYFEGTGDPTQLHPHFKDSTVVNFLKNHNHLAWRSNNYYGHLLGPGWAIEDYQYYYQVERGALPLYGNVVTIYSSDSLRVIPTFFRKEVVPIDHRMNREPESNTFYYDTKRKDTVEIPYRTDSTLTKKLLEKTLEKRIQLVKTMPEGEKSILYGMPVDSVYKRMMQESDNFLADQLLILSSSVLADSLDGNSLRKYILENQLSKLKQVPRWVDGSGLSRYNLFTPESMVHVLDKLYTDVPRKRLFDIFPAGGVSGTLTDWYAGNPKPYIFAKSGSLGNNYSLSGYLLAKSGKVLIFSFMNNHFTQPSSEIKMQMQALFENIRDNY